MPSKILSSLNRRRINWPLLTILLAFTMLTLYQSATLPLGEAADETDHYQYLQFVARTGHPPLTAGQRDEAGYKGGLAPLYYWLTAWPIALVDRHANPHLRRTDARPERHIPNDGLGFNRLLHTLDEQWPWRGQVWAWHVVRFLSLPLAWLTIIATYLLGRTLWPTIPAVALGAALFVAFLPRFVISSAVINDDNLVFTLSGFILWLQVRLLQGDNRPRLFVLLGGLFGLALITKYFSLILIPEILLTFWLSRHLITRSHIVRFTATLCLIAGPWFGFISWRFNQVAELGWLAGLAASLGEPQITEGLVGLLSGQVVRPPAATYSLVDWSSLLYRSFWFEYGWMQIFAPPWIYGFFTIMLLVSLAGLSRSTARLPRQISHLLATRLGLFVGVVLMRYLLSATIDTGQGRHLYPALPVIALLISFGAYQFWQSRSIWGRSVGILLPGGYISLSLFTLLNPAYSRAYYPILPVTSQPPSSLTINYTHSIEFADGLFFRGFNVPDQASAGQTLPVTLYWQAEQEAAQDYLLAVCLNDDLERPVGCWAGHFDNGRYPARAWEIGDLLIDTVSIPLPTCSRLPAATYHLQLTIWALAPDSVAPTIIEPPLVREIFSQPYLTIKSTTQTAPQSASPIEIWQQDNRITKSVSVALRETITLIDYASPQSATWPIFRQQNQPDQPATGLWSPMPQLSQPLYLPCADQAEPVAQLHHLISQPALATGNYHLEAAPEIDLSVSLRERRFAPMSDQLTFADQVAPLTIQFEEATWQPNSFEPQSLRLPQPILPGTLWPVTIEWQSRRWLPEPLIVSLKLLDKDFAIGSQRVAALGDRYPNVLWAPGELVAETYPLRLNPTTPPGLYRLELSLLHHDETHPEDYEYLPVSNEATHHSTAATTTNLYPATVRVLDPAHNQPPTHPFPTQIGKAIELVGYDLSQVGSTIELTLHWQNTGPISQDYTVFTQLLDPAGQLAAQWDNPPQAGRYPTSAWTVPDSVIDRYTLTLKKDAPPGDYQLLVGLYDPLTGERLPVTIAGRPQPDQAIRLPAIKIIPD